jgi:hypothetical protein
MTKITSQKDRVYKLLANGQNLSTAAIAKRAKCANPSAVICKLRDAGLHITTEKVTVKGQTVFKYRLS